MKIDEPQDKCFVAYDSICQLPFPSVSSLHYVLNIRKLWFIKSNCKRKMPNYCIENKHCKHYIDQHNGKSPDAKHYSIRWQTPSSLFLPHVSPTLQHSIQSRQRRTEQRTFPCLVHQRSINIYFDLEVEDLLVSSHRLLLTITPSTAVASLLAVILLLC